MKFVAALFLTFISSLFICGWARGVFYGACQESTTTALRLWVCLEGGLRCVPAKAKGKTSLTSLYGNCLGFTNIMLQDLYVLVRLCC